MAKGKLARAGAGEAAVAVVGEAATAGEMVVAGEAAAAGEAATACAELAACPEHPSRRIRLTTRLLRAVFFVVFAVNVLCALLFIIAPSSYMGNYELVGVAGEAALRGMGVAFLMWNATYPPFIVAPRRHVVLGWIILAQQLIGLVGEGLILATLPAGHATLAAGIRLFILWDAAALVVMALAFAAWRVAQRTMPRTPRSTKMLPCTPEDTKPFLQR